MASRLKQREAVENRLKALAHPLRTAMWRILRERPATISELATELGYDRQAMGNVVFHMGRLEKLGCAEQIGERRVGRRMVPLYKAIDNALIETGEWEQFRKDNPVLADHFLYELEQMQLDNYLAALEAGTLGEDEKWHVSQTPMILDEQGVEDGLRLTEEHRLRMSENEREAAERRKESGEDAIYAYSDLCFFKTPKPR